MSCLSCWGKWECTDQAPAPQRMWPPPGFQVGPCGDTSRACLVITHPYLLNRCDIKARQRVRRLKSCIWYVLGICCWLGLEAAGLGMGSHLLGQRGPPPTGCVNPSGNTTCGPAAQWSASSRGTKAVMEMPSQHAPERLRMESNTAHPATVYQMSL